MIPDPVKSKPEASTLIEDKKLETKHQPIEEKVGNESSLDSIEIEETKAD